ncbi:MAG: hypothetical protein GY932_11175 [Arcobacter sp.]|nr:hypothetical protein [Arcobacter sp.]
MKKKLKYICGECKGVYESPAGAIPYIISWSDGHFCVPKLIGEEEIKELSEKTKTLKEDDLWTTFYN